MLSTAVSPVCFAGSTFNFKRQFFVRFIIYSKTLEFLSQSKRSYYDLLARVVNHQITTDALMLYIKSWKNVLKRFSERWYNP